MAAAISTEGAVGREVVRYRPPVTEAIMKLMARDPERRFQTATEALAVFEAL